MSQKRAFTLIELLVVIAIIAILAAILFPVFAQAKAAAKGAASISNAKQETLAVLMYSGDSDDVLPLGTAWNTGHDQLCYGAGACFAVWSWSVQPYMKNTGLFHDPLATPNPARPTAQDNFDSYYIQYGFNYTWLSPTSGSPQRFTGQSATAAAAPADTVMIGSKWANNENTSGFDWGTGFPPDEGMLAAAAIDVPDCWHIPQWCLDSWGEPSFFADTLLNKNEVAGAFTGGNSERSSGSMVIGWLDGHTKKMKPGALAAGTNWTPTTANSAVVVQDPTKYLWDLQ
jgi:prepilin-type N-terminal cleavage/methylation domain-containing protein